VDKKPHLVNSLSGDSYRALMQVALLGVELGKTSLASEISTELCELRPDLPHAYIVRAMTVAYGQTDESVRMLEDTLIRFPDSQLCKVMLGTCMEILKRPGWKYLLESVIDDGRDENAVGLACALLGRDKDALNAFDGEAEQNQSFPVQVIWA
jgi:hypothetical protein